MREPELETRRIPLSKMLVCCMYITKVLAQRPLSQHGILRDEVGWRTDHRIETAVVAFTLSCG